MKFLDVLSDRLCVLCRHYDAKFTFRGRVKRDKDHNLCHRCYRSLSDRHRARCIADIRHGRVVVYEGSTFFRQALEQPPAKNLRSLGRAVAR
jgi:hypothetical protein